MSRVHRQKETTLSYWFEGILEFYDDFSGNKQGCDKHIPHRQGSSQHPRFETTVNSSLGRNELTCRPERPDHPVHDILPPNCPVSLPPQA